MSLATEEIFDYTAQALNNLNGGTGWGGAYSASTGTNSPQIVDNNLTYTGVNNNNYLGVDTNTNKMYHRNAACSTNTNTTWTRSFNAIPNTVAGAVYWCGFTVASNISKGSSTLKMNKLTTDSAGNTPATILAWTTGLVSTVVSCNGTTVYSGSSAYAGHQVFLKFTMSGAGDTKIRLDVYADVDMATADTSWTPKVTVTDWYVPANITSLTWLAGTIATTSGDAQVYWDNIRWATTSTEAAGNKVASGSGWWHIIGMA